MEEIPYTGPKPLLKQGTTPTTWTLEAVPAGVTIANDTGVVSWSSPENPYMTNTITLRAENVDGYDTEPLRLYVDPLMGRDWTLATATPEWHERHGHTTVVHQGKLWLLGGYYTSSSWPNTRYLSDVWCSDDGTTWTLVDAGAPWTRRRHHASASFDGKIWA